MDCTGLGFKLATFKSLAQDLNHFFMDQDLVLVKGLVYFGECQGYVTRSLMLPGGPRLVNIPMGRGQTKNNSNRPMKGAKQSKCTLPGLGLPKPTPGSRPGGWSQHASAW